MAEPSVVTLRVCVGGGVRDEAEPGERGNCFVEVPGKEKPTLYASQSPPVRTPRPYCGILICRCVCN